MYSLAFCLMVLHISAYSILCLSSPFSTMSRCFVIRAHVGDDILDSSGLLIALATLGVLCWIMSVVVSLMVSMSSSSCSVSNRFLNSSWNSIFLDPICVASTLGGLLVINCFPFHLYVQLWLLINILWSLPILTWLTVTSMTMSRLFVRMYSVSVFVTPFGFFHVHLLSAFSYENGVPEMCTRCSCLFCMVYINLVYINFQQCATTVNACSAGVCRKPFKPRMTRFCNAKIDLHSCHLKKELVWLVKTNSSAIVLSINRHCNGQIVGGAHINYYDSLKGLTLIECWAIVIHLLLQLFICITNQINSTTGAWI